eukprot:TRINITY_DN3868_c0_g2_i1.p2 TRINITY_DN3868_c0_g2~~TRINITY_DN3868_c0_g2_i1.p2  ORF type:complete len:161 (+),score=52.39 TRINITY_DN3868_c0_g2_i1:105-587(+)
MCIRDRVSTQSTWGIKLIITYAKMESDRQESRRLRKPAFIKVNEIKPDKTGYNVYLKVIDVTSDTNVKRFDNSNLLIRDAVCGDETGIVNIRLKAENADRLQKGKVIAIRNGRVEVIQGRIRLEVDRWGKVTQEDNVEIKSTGTKNISDTVYEKVVTNRA